MCRDLMECHSIPCCMKNFTIEHRLHVTPLTSYATLLSSFVHVPKDSRAVVVS